MTWPLRARAGRVLQQLAGRLVGALPAPPEVGILGPLRARLAAEIAARHAGEIAAAKGAFLDGVEAGAPDTPRAALGRLGQSLVEELRGALAAAAGGGGQGALARAATTADGWLATDEEEYLDLPDFDEARRTRELRTIDRLNRGMGSYARFAAALEPLLDGDAPLTVLDIASGHAGFPLALASLRAERRPHLRIIASDLRDEYLEIGRRRAARDGLGGHVEFHVADALRLGERYAPGEIDVITCTQSLHHFGAAATCSLLAEAVRHARRGILFVDLARAPSATVGATALGLLALDRVLMHDAVLSFRKSFVPEELGLLAACVPGGERLEATLLPPAFTLLRTRLSAGAATR